MRRRSRSTADRHASMTGGRPKRSTASSERREFEQAMDGRDGAILRLTGYCIPGRRRPSSESREGVEMDLEQKIQMLERDLREQVKNWERFFSGGLRVPPGDRTDAFRPEASDPCRADLQPPSRPVSGRAAPASFHELLAELGEDAPRPRGGTSASGRAGLHLPKTHPHIEETNGPTVTSVDSSGRGSLYDRYVCRQASTRSRCPDGAL